MTWYACKACNHLSSLRILITVIQGWPGCSETLCDMELLPHFALTRIHPVRRCRCNQALSVRILNAIGCLLANNGTAY